MSELIHGHEVMEFIIDSGRKFSRSSLTQAIEEKFGEETRYYTCSADDLNAGQLVDFLESRGKFLHSEEGFTTDPRKMCSHSHA